jgi:alkyl hydroperoxide reductase subunit D
MSIDTIKSSIPDFAKDIRLNIGRVLTEEGSKGLSLSQIWGVALSCAYATKEEWLISQIKEDAGLHLSDEQVTATKSATSIMAMNNVYYRSLGMISDPNFSGLQTGLRMQVLATHGIESVDFELYSLAVSAINSCKYCIDSHTKKVMAGGISIEGVQSTIKIASVIYAVAQVLKIN